MLKVNQFSLFDWMVKKAAFIAILTCGLMLLSGCEKARVDAELEKLCKQDGGLKIYEAVYLEKNQFRLPGFPSFYISWNKSGSGYEFLYKKEVLKSIKPTLEKNTYQIIRERDRKVLGTFVTYLRVGGDILPRLGPDSFKRCPANVKSNDLIKNTFLEI